MKIKARPWGGASPEAELMSRNSRRRGKGMGDVVGDAEGIAAGVAVKLIEAAAAAGRFCPHGLAPAGSPLRVAHWCTNPK